MHNAMEAAEFLAQHPTDHDLVVWEGLLFGTFPLSLPLARRSEIFRR
jgi:hypothetical protein